MIYAVAAVALVALVGLLLLEGRRRDRAAWRDWDLALTPRGEEVYRRFEDRMRDQMDLVDYALVNASRVEQLGSTDEAIKFLKVGARLVTDYVPTMRRQLAAMAVLSRMAAAMAPVKPLRPRDFNLAQLARLARLNRLIHQFLVGAAERFRLRVYVLRAGFAVAGRQVVQLLSGPAPAPAAWPALEHLRLDVGTLSEETLETLRVLVVSLQQQPALEERLPEEWRH